MKEEFEDTKGVDKRTRQYNDKKIKDKQQSTKHYTEN